MMKRSMSDRIPSDDVAILPFPGPEERGVVDRAAAERDEETALLNKVRDHGDRDAFRRLFELLAPRINSHLRRGGMAPADAENLLQDVFLVVWRKAAMFDARLASARTWIFTLVRNRRIDLEHAAQREHRLIADYARSDYAAESYEVDLLAQAFGARIGAMLGDLPVEQREVLLLIAVEEMTYDEVSKTLDVPIGTVMSRLSRGRERLRQVAAGASVQTLKVVK